MVWKIQRGGPWGGNGGGSGQGSWGGGSGPKGGSQPPDIEEILRRSQEKFKKFFHFDIKKNLSGESVLIFFWMNLTYCSLV